MWCLTNKLAMLTLIWQAAAFWWREENSVLTLIGSALSRYVAAGRHDTAAFAEAQS